MWKIVIAFVLRTCTTPPPATTACAQQCATMAACADEYTMATCTDDCALHPEDPEVAACIVRAGCAGYERRLAMDLDLVGGCEAAARER